MKKVFVAVLVVCGVACCLQGCKKEDTTVQTASIADYFPLKVGSSYTYRLDSTVAATFGTSLQVRSYNIKDSVVSTFNDNQNRLSYIIYRYITDTTGIRPFQFSSTIYATATNNSLEYVDNNLRFLKLKLPVREGYSWYGHSFIDTRSTALAYLDRSNGWDYTYTDVDAPFTVFNKVYDNTVTVAQNDETTPAGPFNPAFDFQQRTFGTEVYAKGVGLIYKDFLYWTWQRTPSPPHYEPDSYGVRMRLISHR